MVKIKACEVHEVEESQASNSRINKNRKTPFKALALKFGISILKLKLFLRKIKIRNLLCKNSKISLVGCKKRTQQKRKPSNLQNSKSIIGRNQLKQ